MKTLHFDNLLYFSGAYLFLDGILEIMKMVNLGFEPLGLPRRNYNATHWHLVKPRHFNKQKKRIVTVFLSKYVTRHYAGKAHLCDEDKRKKG